MTIAAHGPVAEHVRPGSYRVPAGCTVKKLLRLAGLSRSAASVVCLVAGRRLEPTHELSDGDRVTVVQFAAGG